MLEAFTVTTAQSPAEGEEPVENELNVLNLLTLIGLGKTRQTPRQSAWMHHACRYQGSSVFCLGEDVQEKVRLAAIAKIFVLPQDCFHGFWKAVFPAWQLSQLLFPIEDLTLVSHSRSNLH